MDAPLLISVVDDDAASREAVSGLIRSMGHRSAAFACAADFLASADLERTGLLIADLRMPSMTGLQLHQHLTAIGSYIPTVIITAYPTQASREQVEKAGIRFFLTKPVVPSGFASCVETLTGSRAP